MRKTVLVVFASLWMLQGVMPAQTRLSRFQHIVLIVQENRTPDNLFRDCACLRMETRARAERDSGNLIFRGTGSTPSETKFRSHPCR